MTAGGREFQVAGYCFCRWDEIKSGVRRYGNSMDHGVLGMIMS